MEVIGVNNNSTPAGTPAAGRPFPGMRRRVERVVMGQVVCDECGTPYHEDRCPTCAQRRRRRAGLEVAVQTYGGERWWVTLERSDPDDGGGWWPAERRPADDDEPEGWPW
jgi:hypothetical protein